MKVVRDMRGRRQRRAAAAVIGALLAVGVTASPAWAAAPAAPAAPAAVAGNAQIVVTFTATPDDGGSAITAYTATCTSSNGGVANSASNDGSVAPITVGGLTNGKSYTCTVDATNSDPATSPESPSSLAAIPATVPGAPSAPTGAVDDTQITLSFTPPADDGGRPITVYRATCTGDPNPVSVFGSASPIVITNLTRGTTYTCTVTASNAAGTGPASADSAPLTIPALVPDAPAKPTVARGNARITVTFSPRASNGSPTTSFTATCTGVNAPSHVSVSGPDSPIVVTGLTNGVRYTCSVTATNSVGTSPHSAASAEVVPAAVPGAPGTPTVTRGVGQIVVRFTAPPKNGASITHFTATCTSSHVGVTGTHAGPSSPITVTGLTNGRTYTCYVTATNAVGTGPRSPVSASTIPGTAPAPPTILSVIPGRAPGPTGPLGVSFKPGNNNGTAVSSYHATCVPVAPGGTAHVATSTGTPIMVPGLTTGKAYTCYVIAISASGTSGRSGTMTATVGTPGVPKITSTTAHGRGATMSFIVPSNNGNLILRYHALCKSTNGGVTASQFQRSSPFMVNGLTPGGRYSCTLTAINDRGEGPGAISSFVRVPF